MLLFLLLLIKHVITAHYVRRDGGKIIIKDYLSYFCQSNDKTSIAFFPYQVVNC